MNANAGKKPAIPLNINRAASQPDSSATAKIMEQAQHSASTALFNKPAVDTPPAPLAPSIPAPAQEPTISSMRRRRGRRPAATETILKGIYFEKSVYDTLMQIQDRGYNVSRLVNRIVSKHLPIELMNL
jgi:hypothetical protein